MKNVTCNLLSCCAGGRDFSAITDSDLQFQSQTELCIEVMIENDVIHEEQEEFTIQITSMDDAVIFEIDEANIFITDNDGRFRNLCVGVLF